jgi:hypothetical protein
MLYSKKSHDRDKISAIALDTKPRQQIKYSDLSCIHLAHVFTHCPCKIYLSLLPCDGAIKRYCSGSDAALVQRTSRSEVPFCHGTQTLVHGMHSCKSSRDMSSTGRSDRFVHNSYKGRVTASVLVLSSDLRVSGSVLESLFLVTISVVYSTSALLRDNPVS